MSEYVVAQASVLIVPSLEGFQKELKAELKAIQAELRRNALEVDVKAKGIPKMLGEIELAKQAAEEDPIKIRVDTVDVMKKITEIRHKYEDLGRDMKKALVLDLKIAGLSLLPQLAQGLAAANASMVQLAQSGLLLPGILSGVASSILTVVTGLSGVGEAFKEYGDAQKNAAQISLQARNAAKNVDNAYRDLGRTIKDAQRNLEDLNAQLRDAPLDEADAIIRLQEARAEAADQYQKSGLQQQKDALAVRRAENDLATTRLRNSRLVQDVAEANAKGVAGADAVVDATERLSKAQDDAATKTTKLTDSLSKLSPNAQSFIQAVTGMESEWTKFRNVVQDRLFAGLDTEVTNLATNTLPLLTRGFGGIADAINSNVKSALGVFQKPENQGFLDKILGNTADAQMRMSKAVEPFVDGFLKLSEVGSTFLPRLVDGLAQVMQRFENFVNVADKNGSLDKWINGGIDALSALGNSLLNLGSIFTSISEAFTGSNGKGMLDTLEEATDRLAAFLKSDEGQKKLMNFFKDARAQLELWKPLLAQLPGMFSSLAEAGRQVTEALMPFFTTAATLLREHPGLVSAAIQAYVGWKTVAPIVKGINNLLDSELVGSLKNAAKQAKLTYTELGGGFKGATGVMSQSLQSLMGMIGPGGLFMGALTGIVAYMGYQYMDAQNEAAQAAQAHADALRNIATQVDNVTGKLTQSGLVDQLRGLAAYQNKNLTGDPTFDLSNPEKYGLSSLPQISAALLPGDAGKKAFDDVEKKNKEIIRQAVEKSPYFTTNKGLLEGKNITLDDLVNAVAGDAAAAKKLSEASIGFNASDVIQGDKKLFGSVPGLSENAVMASQLNRYLIEQRRNTAAESARVNAATQAVAGTATIKPRTPWEPLGIDKVSPMTDGSGGIKISVNTSAKDIELKFPDLAKLIREKNGTVQADAVGATITFSDPNVAQEYATIEKRASGGLISGPGTGTSDSILTALSNGEYVINAKSTKKHRPLLDAINGGGLPTYYGGGPVPRDPVFDGGDPSSDPGLPAVGNAIAGAWDWLTGPNSMVSGVFGRKPSAPYVDQSGVLQGPWYLPDQGGVAPTDATAGAMVDQGLGAGIGAGAALGSTALNPVDPNAQRSPDLGSLLGADPSLDGTPYPYVLPTTSTELPNTSPLTPGLIPPGTHGKGGTPGPGNDIPHTVPSYRGPGPISPSTQMIGSVFQAMPYGLPLGTSIPYGGAGFPDWVNSLSSRFGVQASTYAGHQERSGLNKGIDFTGTPEQMAALAEYALTAPGVEQVIYEDPNTGRRYGRDPGDRGKNQTIDDYYKNDWAGHRDHVHIRTSQSIPTPEQLMGLSPSNMPMALTPTGMKLPQLTYASDGQGSGTLGGGFKMPSAEEYGKAVVESWQKTIENLVQNAGQIAMKFIGSFFGLDLSGLFNIANSVIGNYSGSGSGGGKDSNLPANSDVASLIQSAEFQTLPPSVQEPYLQAYQAQQQKQQGSGAVQYDPSKGAEQWRPVVRQALSQVASKYGINNLSAWEDDIIGQINFETGGNPGLDNLNDSNGKGGTQQVFGLGQFHPDTFRSHNVTGGDIHDPVAQIFAMIDYLASPKYGVVPNGGVNWKGNGWRNGKGYAAGGSISGSGSGKSDSILARVSNGEYIVKADAAQKHLGLLNAINSNALPGFSDGMLWPVGQPAPVTPPPITTPDPPPAPVPPDPTGPAASADAGIPAAPTPVTEAQGPGDAASAALSDLGSALGGIGGALQGADAPAGADPTGDPRAIMGAAPQNLDHNKPAVSKGIESAAGAIAGAVSTAMQAASVAANAQAPGSGQGVSSAAGLVTGLISAGGSAVSGAVNILSSLGVGSLTPTNSTGGAYGAAMTPETFGQQPYTGPAVVNNFNGGVHTSNNEEFYKLQQRRELQNASPYLPQR